MDQRTNQQEQPIETANASYEPPRIERVLTPEELEREVLYAGLLPTVDAVG